MLVNPLLMLADWFAPDVAARSAAPLGLTVKDVDVPLTPPDAIFSVVLCASNSVIDGDALPFVNATEEG